MTQQRPICNYEDSRYSTEFWTSARSYEHAVEHVAMRALLPPQGHTLIEVGAGFGRLADLYTGYDTVVILDYARTQLEQAIARLGTRGPQGKPHYIYVQANFYHFPFVQGLFDTVTMIRTLHHATDAPAVLHGVADILRPRGTFILEFANKHNLKAILRYVLRRQSWSPFAPEPVEFADLNFDFHPKYIWTYLERAGLRREATRTVSHFRVELLKNWIPTPVLAAVDALLQPTGALLQVSPSVFVRARAGAGKTSAAPGTFFRCPTCGAPLGAPPQTELTCPCGKLWQQEGQIYNFLEG